MRHNLLSFAFGVPGLVMLFGSPQVIDGLKQPGPANGILLFPIMLIGPVLLLVGGIFFAKYKGIHPMNGFFILLGCIGLIVLAVLEDRKGKQILRLKRALREF